MEKTMRVVVIEPDKPAQTVEIENSLTSMQSVVGGYIEIVSADWMPGGAVLRKQNFLLVMNEEGKLNGLKPNFPIRGGADYICGTVFICKGLGDEMAGLSEEEATLVAGLLARRGDADG